MSCRATRTPAWFFLPRLQCAEERESGGKEIEKSRCKHEKQNRRTRKHTMSPRWAWQQSYSVLAYVLLVSPVLFFLSFSFWPCAREFITSALPLPICCGTHRFVFRPGRSPHPTQYAQQCSFSCFLFFFFFECIEGRTVSAQPCVLRRHQTNALHRVSQRKKKKKKKKKKLCTNKL